MAISLSEQLESDIKAYLHKTFGRTRPGSTTISYRGVAQLVARLLWECRGGIRDRVRRNAAKPCDTCVCGISTDCRKRYKSGFDHINDHRQKKL